VIWIRTDNQTRTAVAAQLRRYAGLIVDFESSEAVCLEIY